MKQNLSIFVLTIIAIIVVSILWEINEKVDLSTLILSSILIILWLYMTKKAICRKIDLIIFIIANFIFLSISIGSFIKDKALRNALAGNTIDRQVFENNHFLNGVLLVTVLFSFLIIIYLTRKKNHKIQDQVTF